jgi:hypothetical protein
MNSMAEMFPTPSRFKVEQDMFGVYVRDTFSGQAVRDGKGNVMRFPLGQTDMVTSIADEMNERTAGITVEDSAVHILTDEEMAKAA